MSPVQIVPQYRRSTTAFGNKAVKSLVNTPEVSPALDWRERQRLERAMSEVQAQVLAGIFASKER